MDGGLPAPRLLPRVARILERPTCTTAAVVPREFRPITWGRQVRAVLLPPAHRSRSPQPLFIQRDPEGLPASYGAPMCCCCGHEQQGRATFPKLKSASAWLACTCRLAAIAGVMAGQPELLRQHSAEGIHNTPLLMAAALTPEWISWPVESVGRAKPPPRHCGCAVCLFTLKILVLLRTACRTDGYKSNRENILHSQQSTNAQRLDRNGRGHCGRWAGGRR